MCSRKVFIVFKPYKIDTMPFFLTAELSPFNTEIKELYLSGLSVKFLRRQKQTWNFFDFVSTFKFSYQHMFLYWKLLASNCSLLSSRREIHSIPCLALFIKNHLPHLQWQNHSLRSLLLARNSKTCDSTVQNDELLKSESRDRNHLSSDNKFI